MTIPSPHPRLLHIHLFKHGGSTLDSILQRHFGPAFEEVHGSHENATLAADQIAEVLAAHPHATALSSHHFRPPFTGLPNVLPLWLLRHPLDRIPSVFGQERRASGTPDRFPPLGAWIDRTLEERPYAISNTQTAVFGNRGHHRDLRGTSVLAAIDAVETSAFIGVVNDYDRSMVVLEAVLRTWWPDFDASHVPQNAGSRAPTLDARLDQLHRDAGPERFDRLAAANTYDLVLYRCACAHLDRLFAAVPNATEHLADLRARNSRRGVTS